MCQSTVKKMEMCLLILFFQGASWSFVEALPAMEPDYDIPVSDLHDPTASPPSEIAYTFKSSVVQETTPDNKYAWDDKKDILSKTEQSTNTDAVITTNDYTEIMGTSMPEQREKAYDAAADTDNSQEQETEVMPTDAPSSEIEELRSGIIYRLYTRAHPMKEMILKNDSVEGSDFDFQRPTVFLIHGFTGDANSDSVTLIRDALLWAEDANVVAVDWAPLAAGPHYESAVNNTRVVAAALAAHAAALVAAGLPLARLHFVGFSLGAQVAGLAGGALRASAGPVPRITALDPARPGFHDVSDAERLDATDADFVLVLHTASGLVSFEEPLGHADFYANSGRSPQPACTGQSVHGTQEHKLIDPAPVVCSHLIAPRYFSESIYKPKNFRGTLCRSWRDFEAGLCAGGQVAFLGHDTPPSTRGTFFFRTNPTEPYGRGSDTDDSLGAKATDDEDGNRLDGRTGRKHDLSASSAREANTAAARAAPAALVAAAAVAAVSALLRAASPAA